MFNFAKGNGNDFAKRDMMSLRTQAARKCKRLFRENKMASAGAASWLPDTDRFFMELSTMMTRTP